jgi:hypothetical protein
VAALVLCLGPVAVGGEKPAAEKEQAALQGLWSLRDKKKSDNFEITLDVKGARGILKFASKNPAVRGAQLGTIEIKTVKGRRCLVVGRYTMPYLLKGDELTLDIPEDPDPLGVEGVDPFRGRWTLIREKAGGERK